MPSLDQVDIWTAIQSGADTSPKPTSLAPYIHPLVKKSSQLLSQKSLEICTESLGSETGSEFSSDSEFYSSASSDSDSDSESSNPKSIVAHNISSYKYKTEYDNELMTVNYHCSGGTGGGRMFPPPLPSIARRDGRPCLRMRPHRQDGRLVVQAVPVKSNTYLHANRNNGCLRLSFIDCLSSLSTATSADLQNATEALPLINQMEAEKQVQQEDDVSIEEEEEEVAEITDQEQQEEEEMEEEEVEVVERRTVIEVKVSTQNVKTHRSSLVLNKFLGGTPDSEAAEPPRPLSPSKRATAATAATSAAAAVVAAASSSLNGKEGGVDGYDLGDTKLLFTSRRRDKEELLRSVRRCSQLRRPLFFWEPCCIATSS